MTFDKPLQGIIIHWRLDAGRVAGQFTNGKYPQCSIITSPMVQITNMGTFGILETRNSVYILMDTLPDRKL